MKSGQRDEENTARDEGRETGRGWSVRKMEGKTDHFALLKLVLPIKFAP